MFKSAVNTACNNTVFSYPKMGGMHATMTRLYRAAKEAADIHSQAELARALNTTSQRVKNWENRGISQAGANEAQTLIGVNSTYVLQGEGTPLIGNRPVRDASVPTGHVRLDYLGDFGPLTGPRFMLLPEQLVLQRIGSTPIDNVRWIHAPSVSMAPEIERGALVLVDTSVTRPEQFVDGNIYAYSVWGSPGILRRAYVRKGRYEFRGVLGEEAHASDIHFEDVPKHLKVYGLVLGAFNPK